MYIRWWYLAPRSMMDRESKAVRAVYNQTPSPRRSSQGWSARERSAMPFPAASRMLLVAFLWFSSLTPTKFECTLQRATCEAWLWPSTPLTVAFVSACQLGRIITDFHSPRLRLNLIFPLWRSAESTMDIWSTFTNLTNHLCKEGVF